jgi:hypothetical protein
MSNGWGGVVHDTSGAFGQDTGIGTSRPIIAGVGMDEFPSVFVDGEPVAVSGDTSGNWDAVFPELEDGSHDVEIKTRNPETGEFETVEEYSVDVQADAAQRAADAAAVREWEQNGRRGFQDANKQFQAEHAGGGGGGGGGGGQPPEALTTGSGPSSTTGSGQGSSGGEGSGGGGGSPPSEKGNAPR